MTRALVVDDEPAICHCFETLFSELNCDVMVTASAESGLEMARGNRFDVIVLDVRLPGMDGLAAVSQFRDLSDAPIIVMTAHGSLTTAVSAVQEGAFDYLPKPFELAHVTQVLKQAIAESVGKMQPPEESLPQRTTADELVGNSLPMQHLYRQIAMTAQHDAPVLITGESGTGKELVAHAIHHHSGRKQRSIVPVHLASLNESLLERELFGNSAGAFTGAESSRDGVIAKADRGTLFLDEIGETPKSFQVKLLRTIESGEYYPVGSASAENSDFRLIAATNRSVEFLRCEDHFRADLFYRLATIQIHVPPLRDRKDDIALLSAHFLRECTGNDTRRFTAEATRVLEERSYPGNVRELRNVVVRAAAESTEQAIGPNAITESVDTVAHEPVLPDAELHRAAQAWADRALQEGLASPLAAAAHIVDAEVIAVAMKLTKNNRTAAAQLLGIHRETLRDRLAKHDKTDSEVL